MHEIIMEANEYMLDHQDDDRTPPSSGSGKEDALGDSQEKSANREMLIVDAACVPVNIRVPQDILLLNEAREKLETSICGFCKSYRRPLPKRYMRKARKESLSFAKARQDRVGKIGKETRVLGKQRPDRG